MKTNISSIALAVIGIGSLAFAIPMSVARAQQSRDTGNMIAPVPGGKQFQQQPGGPPPQTQPGFPGQGGGMMMQNHGMGGGAAMVADGDSLYILQGNRLFKVSKSNLKVVKEGQLPMNPPMGGGGGQGGNGGDKTAK